MLPVLISLVPVLSFLALLIYLDNYKLLKLSFVLKSLCLGIIAAVAAWLINLAVLQFASAHLLRTLYAPIIEEILKAVFPLLLLKKGKIGFLVDGAILGFAAGSGFAFFENCYYLINLNDQHLMVWILRGFGTALMHGGNTAIVMMIAVVTQQKNTDSHNLKMLSGLPIAVLIHSFFNLFLLPPLVNMIFQVLAMPLITIFLFGISERNTSTWLQKDFDSDMILLEKIQNGSFFDSQQGRYLARFKSSLPPDVVIDLFCYLRVYLELAIRAKGILLMKESRFKPNPDPYIKNQFNELDYLESNIGFSGMSILKPLIHKSKKELWQIYFLEKNG